MKKILFSLVALMCCMSMNAQRIRLMKGNTVVATYSAAQVDNVVFEEETEEDTEPVTTGTAKRNDNIEVNWVQLWADGPKFADRNVEGTMTFTQAIADPFIWGANWCTPSKADMDELLKAATSAGSEKVKCEFTQEGSTYGFKFTGLTAGYTDNSVFFPAQYGDSSRGHAYYWSGTANGSRAWNMYLNYYYGDWLSGWDSGTQDFDFRVRPVLKN